MALPTRATLADIETVCGYLLTKPTGASQAEAKAVLDASTVDLRKLSALKFWGLIDDSTGKMRLTERGRSVARDKGAKKAPSLQQAISEVPAYRAVVERAVHRNELTASATDVAAYWHQHFRSEASESDELINQQAICFFQLAEGADLGTLVVGRKGQPTRFEFDEGTARTFVENSDAPEAVNDPEERHAAEPEVQQVAKEGAQPSLPLPVNGNRVFITHGRNKKILEQIKRAAVLGGFEPIVSIQSETAAKPVPQKVMDDMRSCGAAVIHVGSETDEKGNARINPNVLIEIGAAMALYRDRFILVVEEGLELPSNLQGLYQSRYSGDGLGWDDGLKILEALRGLKAS